MRIRSLILATVALGAMIALPGVADAQRRGGGYYGGGYGGSYIVRPGPYQAPNWGQYQQQPILPQAPPGNVPWNFGVGTMNTCYYINNGRCYYYGNH